MLSLCVAFPIGRVVIYIILIWNIPDRFVGSVDLPGGYCSLNYCPEEPKDPSDPTSYSCATDPSSPGINNRTSGWVVGRHDIKARAAGAIIVNGADSTLANFSLEVESAFALLPAVWAQGNATRFVASGLNVTLLQQNVSRDALAYYEERSGCC